MLYKSYCRLGLEVIRLHCTDFCLPACLPTGLLRVVHIKHITHLIHTPHSHPHSQVGLGLLAAVAASHLRLSRLNALKFHVSGSSHHPHTSRPLHVQAFLNQHGDATQLLGLEGCLFDTSSSSS